MAYTFNYTSCIYLFILRIFTDFTCQILISYKYILHSTTAYYNPVKFAQQRLVP